MATTVELSSEVSLRDCDRTADGGFIRHHTRSNFHSTLDESYGWNEPRHQLEPVDPGSYRMVYWKGRRIGFFRTRPGDGFLYLVTIQLVPSFRERGIGLLLMGHLEEMARRNGFGVVRLRVFKTNRAAHLYERLGYVEIESDEYSRILEKVLD